MLLLHVLHVGGAYSRTCALSSKATYGELPREATFFPTAPNLVFVANFGVDFADSYHLTNPSYPFQV